MRHLKPELVEVIKLSYVDDDGDAVAEFWSCDGVYIGAIVAGETAAVCPQPTGDEN